MGKTIIIGILHIETIIKENIVKPISIAVLLESKVFIIEKLTKEKDQSEDDAVDAMMGRFFKLLFECGLHIMLFSPNFSEIDGYLILSYLVKHFATNLIINLKEDIFLSLTLNFFSEFVINTSSNVQSTFTFRSLNSIIPKFSDIKYADSNLINFDFNLYSLQIKGIIQFELKLLIYYRDLYKNRLGIYNFHKIYNISVLGLMIFSRTGGKFNSLNPFKYLLLKDSYMGGLTLLKDKYLHVSNKTLYYYDINSLYPYAMCKYLPDKFVGYRTDLKVETILKDRIHLGFYYCTIRINLKYRYSFVPYNSRRDLKYYDQDKQVIKGLFFSEEIKFFHKIGHDILEVEYGFLFTKRVIFKSFVTRMYTFKNREGFEKLYKIILNTLYGNTGVSPLKSLFKVRRILPHQDAEHVIESEFILTLRKDQISRELTLLEYMEFYNKNHFEIRDMLVQYDGMVRFKDLKLSKNEIMDKSLNSINSDKYPDSSFKGNIAIASAITSYSRIHMSNYLINEEYNVYYSDTDSIIIDKPLPSKLVGKELGRMKLVDEIKELYIIDKKRYAYINNQGRQVVKYSGTKNVSFNEFLDAFNNKKPIYKVDKSYTYCFKTFRLFYRKRFTFTPINSNNENIDNN